MTSTGLQPSKSHHSSLFSVFHRRKRQSATPVVPQSTTNLADFDKKDKPPPGPRSKQKNKKNNIDLIDGMKTSQSQTLVPKEKAKKKKKESLAKGKAFSADCINELDPEYLTEALMAIGDNQPVVARSTPKHAVIRNSEKKAEHRQRKDCLFQPEVYEKMLSDSLAVCDLLTSHLDECISTVRSRSPVLERKLINSPVPGFDSLPHPGSPLPAHSGPYLLQTKPPKDRIPPIR